MDAIDRTARTFFVELVSSSRDCESPARKKVKDGRGFWFFRAADCAAQMGIGQTAPLRIWMNTCDGLGSLGFTALSSHRR